MSYTIPSKFSIIAIAAILQLTGCAHSMMQRENKIVKIVDVRKAGSNLPLGVDSQIAGFSHSEALVMGKSNTQGLAIGVVAGVLSGIIDRALVGSDEADVIIEEAPLFGDKPVQNKLRIKYSPEMLTYLKPGGEVKIVTRQGQVTMAPADLTF